MDDAKFKAFFTKLAQALKSEFSPQNYGNLEVTNNFEVRNDYNVTVSITLRCHIRINITCDFTFPSKGGPKLYVTELYDSPIINKLTSEINYSSFYLWSGNNCKVSDLVAKVDLYFQNNPPKRNMALAEISLMYKDVQTAAQQKLANLDYNRLEGFLNADDKIKAANPAELPSVLKGSLEYKECQNKLAVFGRKGLDLTGTINR